jgi:hypothetical protein
MPALFSFQSSVINELANAVPLVVLAVVAFEGEGGPDALPSAL